jgi:hypothetical protein
LTTGMNEWWKHVVFDGQAAMYSTGV